MIFDIIVIAIFVVLIAVNIYRGAARSIANLISTIISYVAATALGQLISGYVYESFVKPAISNVVTNAVNSVSTDAANSIVSALPTWLTGILDVSGDDLTNLFKEPISGVNETITNAVNNAVKPVAMGIITFFITIVLFFIFVLILRMILVKPIIKLFRFPVLNAVNRILGAVIGVIDALLLVCMLAYLTKLILVNVGSDSAWFNESTIYNSLIFYHFYNGNIFTWISSMVSG